MSVISVTELPTGRGMSLGERWKRNYMREFQVYTNNRNDGPLQVLNAVGIPLYSSYVNIDGSESDPLALANNIRPQQDSEDPFKWTVQVSYSSVTFDFQKYDRPKKDQFDPSQPVGPLDK